MRFISISMAALALCGCASQSDGLVSATAPTVVATSNTQVTPQYKLVCHRETSIGSSMIHSVCETEQTAAERQALQDKLLDNASTNAAAHQGVGH
jgi:hypothetical protein